MNEIPEFLNELNDSQRAAVEYIDGPSLVIAGAGSGKTRVLTYKIAYLLTQGVKPWDIMALTFNNKAAKEMKERIAALVGMEVARYLRMGTFHSVFSLILRSEANKIGFDSNFTIYDESDSRSLCKQLIKEFGLDDKVYKPGEVMKRISAAKNRLLTADDYAEDFEAVQRDAVDGMPKIHIIYKEYANRCRLVNAMDFDDLLLNTYLLFKYNPEVCNKYAEHFQFVLVDEYQDTNHVQQQIVMQLTKKYKRVCVVGDDAQSIYGFRGANIDNILDFQEQYDGARLFKLEQNYRSTQRIVEAANSLIHKNERQIHKDVYSRNDEGDRIELTGLNSDREEALFVVKDIRQRIRQEGAAYSDFAILYRTNSQSRAFEDELLKVAMPYRIYGGLSFYQRKEIKDVVAYFRLIINANDEEALRRVINYPARGIGNTTIEKVAAAARISGISMWDVLCQPERTELNVNKGTLTKLTSFRMMIEDFAGRVETVDAFELGKDIIKQAGISQEIYSSTEPDYLARQEHIEEFLSSMQEFVEDQREQGNPTDLVSFLQDVSLLSDREDDTDDTPRITLMTVHSAKGLEFPNVYVVGLEEDIFPSQLSMNSMREIEEERRLLYVAITRAEKYCHLTYARMRFRFGKQEFHAPSRFLRDIDPKLLNVNGGSSSYSPARRTAYSGGSRPSLFGSAPEYGSVGRSSVPQQRRMQEPDRSPSLRPVSKASFTSSSATRGGGGSAAFSIGDHVVHDRFGAGIVTNMEGNGDSAKATVEFTNAGTKQLLLKFAKLRKL